MLAAMIENKKKMIPERGFNVVGADTFEDPGEQLYVISHHGTEDEAKAALAAWKKQHPRESAYVYGPDTQ